MPTPLPSRLLALFLLAGTALLGAGAVMHPMLAGGGAEQLRIIASTPGWRLMHLSMLTGSALVICGLWARLDGASEVARPAFQAALVTIAIGLVLNALNIAFMAGAGWHMAEWFAVGQPDMAPIYDATHPIGLVAARLGNGVIALGAIGLGWAEWSEGGARWAAALAWIAAAGGLVGVVCFDESSRLILGAVALLSAWQVVTALRVLIRHRPPA